MVKVMLGEQLERLNFNFKKPSVFLLLTLLYALVKQSVFVDLKTPTAASHASRHTGAQK